jgi:hypothetical protein
MVGNLLSKRNRYPARGVIAVAAVAVIAGCGSGGSTAGPQTTSAPTTSSPSTGATSIRTTTPSAHAAAGIAQCRRVVEARPGLSTTVKGQLDELCQKAASENPIAVRQSAEQVCVDLVNSSTIPAGVSKSQALAACKTA